MSKKETKVDQHQLYLSGLSTWIRLLRENTIDRKYWWMGFKISIAVLFSQPLQWIERAMFWIKGRNTKIHPEPIFIIGHWRSGTTHLHYLLTRDQQFGYLSNYQAFLFNVSLLGGPVLKKILSPFFPKERPQDNVQLDSNAIQQ